MNSEKKGPSCTFLWFIEKYSYCWHKNGELLRSPVFTFDGLGETKWFIDIYPKGRRAEDIGNISLFINRGTDTGFEEFEVNVELSILSENGSALRVLKHKIGFKINTGTGSYQFVPADYVHLRRKADYLPNDTLSIRCVMWKDKGYVQNDEQIVARTGIITKHFSFYHTVASFSTLQENVKNKSIISSTLNNKFTIASSLYFVRGLENEEKIIIEIAPSDADRILHECKFHLRDKTGYTECGGFDNVYNAAEIKRTLSLSLTRQAILNRKNEYLTDDRLVVLCQCTFSTGITTDRVEESRHELLWDMIKHKTNHGLNDDALEAKRNMFTSYPSASDDIKALYISQRLTDVELKTETKSFPAHKIILCARSPVFEAMMTSDMKEKNTACIRVDDLENDTVEKLLLFLYSDSLEALQWKSAIKLYYAADKYQIGKLKAMCSSFLSKNLNASNASELLLLADTHNDCNLRKIVEDFIMKNEAQVFGSVEWEKLIETNPLLVIKTMHLKYKRQK